MGVSPWATSHCHASRMWAIPEHAFLSIAKEYVLLPLYTVDAVSARSAVPISARRGTSAPGCRPRS